jgi:hypothetical protein
LGDSTETKVDPAKNQRRISTQHQRVRDHIRSEIDNWPGFDKLAGKRIIPYAMGSAVTNCFEGSNFNIHNQLITIEHMAKVADKVCARLDGSVQQVRTLHNLMQGPNADEIDGTLTLLYGLPVYAGILEKFGLVHLSACGYGLRYGLYAWQHMWNRNLDELLLPAGAPLTGQA